MSERPRIVLTGAAGFLGRRLLRRLRSTHHVIAIDRQPRADPDFSDHPNVEWHPIDLADPGAVEETFDAIGRGGGAEYLVHLAAWYDFTGQAHPEYERTNVEGTRLVLERAEGLGLRLLVFASSVAACGFSSPGRPITEDTPPHGEHVYAATKRKGEEMLRERARRLRSCIVRFAALYSDWSEYPPLHAFLETWLSSRWNARILGGAGASAVPFLHVRDAASFVLRALERADDLEPAGVLLASPDGAVTHRELFEAATSYRFGAPRAPLMVPKALARVGMWGRDLAGRVRGERPFEQPWMADYIDTRMEVDASRTRRRLGWAPRARLEILNRIPFIVENRETDPMEWYRRNREALAHLELRPNFRVYRLLLKHGPEIARRYAGELSGEGGAAGMPGYGGLPADEREWIARLAVHNLAQAVRAGEKRSFMSYCRDFAERRAQQGFRAAEVVHAIRSLERICLETLKRDPEAAGLDRAMRDYVSMTLEFGIDQVIEAYEDAAAGSGANG